MAAFLFIQYKIQIVKGGGGMKGVDEIFKECKPIPDWDKMSTS